ncbi:MAG: DUF5060 domain-containing protein, partial [Bacteroidota bacterium]
MKEGRHGSGFVVIDNYLYTASGSGNRGGGPELTSIERLELPIKPKDNSHTNIDSSLVYKQFHTITLDFEGPETSESNKNNPFLNYRLKVKFTNGKSSKTIRGFYATDGNAAETSAEKGNIWRVRFSPETLGKWSYLATLSYGDSIALSDDPNSGTPVGITNSKGHFIVTKSDKEGDDFRAFGRLGAYNGFFKFNNTNKYWIKGGTNSPENLLAYTGFDGTYRINATQRDGEASTNDQIHSYLAHTKDWKP